MASRQALPIFHAFTIKYSGRVNRIITELVLFPAFDPDDQTTSPPEGFMTTALWDTGATMSLITQEVAALLKITPVGVTKVNHVGGAATSNSYLVNLGLPNRVMVKGVLVVEGKIGNDVGAIIGMDVINQSDFAITNVDGQSWMTFRHPSVEPIDYVVVANRIVYSGTKRNAPCPCGKVDESGRAIKFKNCHGATR